ncbi:hypothetical protein [Daejeonia sp. YH14]|uniref:HU domain-containing protein n=1 Tax=Daejeonia sp. YH14 TaxID=3439042 RepID=UPI003F494407
MMDLSSYISECLCKDQKAAIAGFGSFTLKNSGARILAGDQKILPPAKEIFFAADDLTQDQGLISIIANREDITTGKASAFVQVKADTWKKKLNGNTEFSIPGIGRFVPEDGKMIFYGERLNIEAPDFFGLENIDLTRLGEAACSSKTTSSSGEYTFNKTILWIFLLIIPVAGLLVLAVTQREKLFGKESFTVKNATHRIDTAPKIPAKKVVSKVSDSLKTDSAAVKKTVQK